MCSYRKPWFLLIAVVALIFSLLHKNSCQRGD